MLVTVLFLGPRLAEAVEMLERSRKGSDRSYLVIHYHPSLVTVQYNLAKVYIKTFYKSRTTDSSLIYLLYLRCSSPPVRIPWWSEISRTWTASTVQINWPRWLGPWQKAFKLCSTLGPDCLETNREWSSALVLLHPEVRIQGWGILRTP